MPKRRRGGYVFLGWKEDHSPHHVRVYREGQFIVKWDLDNWQPIKGQASRHVLQLIRELLGEGLL
jgi:hypothetical protein